MKKATSRILTRFVSAALAVSILIFAMLLPCYATSQEQAFIDSVEALRESDSYNWDTAIEDAALKLVPLGEIEEGAVSSELFEAYEYYISEKAMFDSALEFINEYYNELEDNYSLCESFSQLCEYMEGGRKILDTYSQNGKFKGYVQSAISKFKEFERKYLELMDTMDKFVQSAAAAAQSQSYSKVKSEYDMAVKYKDVLLKGENSEDFFEGHEGFDEANANLLLAGAFISAKDTEAASFIEAVQSISQAQSIYSALCEAYSEMQGVDSTANEVQSAKSALTQRVANYNAAVRAANAASKQAGVLGVGVLY